MSRVPLLVILGSTGTGKSRLGIELARKFNGEIISADSMQVYTDLNIVTAKVTEEEREMAPHHMLDIVNPLTRFTVTNFKNMALPIIDDIAARKKMPIIVGGTYYYVESLLWDVLINSPAHDPEADELGSEAESGDEGSPTKRIRLEESEVSNEELHRRLAEVDPEMANKLHPNNRRKVMRSLEVYEQHGVTHTELLTVQRQAGGSGLGGPLRYPNSVILCLRCSTDVLKQRLNERVDAMLEAGLVNELLDFHQRYNEERVKSNTSPDYTKGIFQTIGFKEFHDYLMMSKEERESDTGRKLLEHSISELKRVTAKYAKKQERWVKNRIICRSNRQVPSVYGLDCTDLKKWNENVLEPAVSILTAVINGEKPKQEALNENVVNGKMTDNSNDETHFCEVCERILIGSFQWNAHINGMKHRRKLTRQKKSEAQSKVTIEPDTESKT